MVCLRNKPPIDKKILHSRSIHGESVHDWIARFRFSYFAHTAKTAIFKLRQLLKMESGAELLAPSYNCGSEIDALMKSGFSIQLYSVSEDLRIDVADLRRRISGNTRVVYVIHYFGHPQDLSEVMALKEEFGFVLVEDCALSILSTWRGRPVGSCGDIAVFSLAKSLPVIDGGVLATNNPEIGGGLAWELRNPPFLRIALLLLKSVKACICPRLFPIAYMKSRVVQGGHIDHGKEAISNREEEAIHTFADMPRGYYYDGSLTNLGISSLSLRVLKAVDVNHIVRKRRANYSAMLDVVRKCTRARPLFGDLPEGVNPLNFPVIVKNNRSIAKKFKEAGIEAISWWCGYHNGVSFEEFTSAVFLKENVLTIPIHESLRNRHLEFIRKAVASYLS